MSFILFSGQSVFQWFAAAIVGPMTSYDRLETAPSTAPCFSRAFFRIPLQSRDTGNALRSIESFGSAVIFKILWTTEIDANVLLTVK